MMKSILLDKYEGAFKILSRLKRCVWIVRLFQPRVVDYLITADASRGRISNRVEMFPIILSADSLKLCRGDRANKLHVAEVRGVVEI